MKKVLFFIAVFLVGVTLQGGFWCWPSSQVKADLPLLLVIHLAMTGSFWLGGLAVLVAGLAMEALASPLPGVVSLTYLFLFVLAHLAREALYLEGILMRLFLVFIFSIFQKGTESFLLGRGDLFSSLGLWTLFSLLQTSIALVLFPLLARLEAKWQEKG